MTFSPMESASGLTKKKIQKTVSRPGAREKIAAAQSKYLSGLISYYENLGGKVGEGNPSLYDAQTKRGWEKFTRNAASNQLI